MSFYEDCVADGSHCSSCGQYMGDDVGFSRVCSDCNGGQGIVSKKQRKEQSMQKFGTWLAKLQIPHTIHNNGYHIILSLPDGTRIDCWPSARKWQQRGKRVSKSARDLNRLVIQKLKAAAQ